MTKKIITIAICCLLMSTQIAITAEKPVDTSPKITLEGSLTKDKKSMKKFLLHCIVWTVGYLTFPEIAIGYLALVTFANVSDVDDLLKKDKKEAE